MRPRLKRAATIGAPVSLPSDFHSRVTSCRACPRLVAHREAVAREPPRRFRGCEYWARPVPSLGGEGFRLLIVGLAPAAHGANRTGRMFTGDRSGEWLYEALHRFGFSSAPYSPDPGDGLRLLRTRITAAIHCAPPGNRPTAEELAACQPFLEEELREAARLRVVLALGSIAFRTFLRTWKALGHAVPAPLPRFGPGAGARLAPATPQRARDHPSPQNPVPGRLTRPMFHEVFATARELCGE
ncbi:MAG: uracil-DNA glycosylase [Acidobacteria bacterium]|nr:uracil-DNA glycosylase [Acidobacteriota bacterium]